MSPSDYERKPRTAEKSRHVMLEESWGEDKHKNWTLASALRLRPTPAKPVWDRVGGGGRRGMEGELVKHFEQWQNLNRGPDRLRPVCFITRKLPHSSQGEPSKITGLYLLHEK